MTGIRFVEKNRRDVEEKSELLRAIQQIGALFSGLAHVALTQLIVTPPDSPVSPRETARNLLGGRGGMEVGSRFEHIFSL